MLDLKGDLIDLTPIDPSIEFVVTPPYGIFDLYVTKECATST